MTEQEVEKNSESGESEVAKEDGTEDNSGEDSEDAE